VSVEGQPPKSWRNVNGIRQGIRARAALRDNSLAERQPPYGFPIRSALDTTAEAPIFEIADVGFVGDLFAILPALKEQLAKALL
jgi:hypothetical protein